jgi:cation:H+ antiporter
VDILTLSRFILGLVLLVAGAETLVRGASKLAAAVGISPLVIGLTVVAYGTSAPEMAVSVQSALAGQTDLALGNIVGSNIFNVLFILGLSAMITPLVVSRQLIKLDVPIMIGVAFLLALLALDGNVSRIEGALLFAGGVTYTVFIIRQSRKEKKPAQDEYDKEYGHAKSKGHWLVNLGLIIIGLGLLVLGSRWLVNGAIAIAQKLGVSELIIGLTIIAAGTSLPEVATSIIASIRGERGNVVGSNIFNILSVLGLTALVAPSGVNVSSAALRFDIPVMLAVAVACLPIFFSGNLIARWEGALFLGYYIAYTLYLILSATQHDALPAFSLIMESFVLPLTAITFVIVIVRSLRAKKKEDRL